MTATKYTLQDVAERNKDGTVYVAIHGKVYNCTRFIENHPSVASFLLFSGRRRESVLTNTSGAAQKPY
jgi:cytochrome b involved in lipid metabolism